MFHYVKYILPFMLIPIVLALIVNDVAVYVCIGFFVVWYPISFSYMLWHMDNGYKINKLALPPEVRGFYIYIGDVIVGRITNKGVEVENVWYDVIVPDELPIKTKRVSAFGEPKRVKPELL